MGRLTTFVISLTVLLAMASPHTPQQRRFTLLTLDAPVSYVAVIGDSYTTGTDEGGQGPRGWAARTWQTLARQGFQVVPYVVAEGGAGYGVRGNHGSVFLDLTARAVRPNDALVVFFGSRNDQGVDPALLPGMVQSAFDLARRTAPAARLLVVGPPWPTADVPHAVLQIRDILDAQAQAAGATFVDPIAERWFFGRPDLIGQDGVHPTDAGHAYMADKMAPLIGSQLSVQPWTAAAAVVNGTN